MLRHVEKTSVLGTLVNNLNNCKCSVFGCTQGEKLTIVNESSKFVVFVAKSKKDALATTKLFNDAGRRAMCLTDDYVYDNSTIGQGVVNTIMSTLTAIVNGAVDVLVVTPNMLKVQIPEFDHISKAGFSIKKGDVIDIDKLSTNLASSGYVKVDLATENLTFAVRGEVIDIVTSQGMGYRIILDYDAVQSINNYNVITLLTSGKVDELNLNVAKFLDVDKLNCEIAWNIPFAKNKFTTITQFVKDSLLVVDDTKACYDEFCLSVDAHNEYINDCISNETMTAEHKKLLWDKDIFIPDSAIGFQYITTDNKFFKPNRVFNIPCIPTISYVSNWGALVSDIKSSKDYTVILFAKDAGSANRLQSYLTSNGINSVICTTCASTQIKQCNIVISSYPASANFAQEKLLIVGSSQLFTTKKQINTDTNLSAYDGFLPQSGDIVVHNTYGVGRCLGVECLKLSTNNRDYCIVEYAGGDKLYLPVENIDTISKFVGSDTPPKLNKLGSSEFEKTKTKVKGQLKELAFDLVQLYKARAEIKGYKYPQDDELQQKFEDAFGYELTADQAIAVDDIKRDMVEGKVMDRLICGDVGFGKTEVALRAAFKTILAGKQVVFLCPTTILSEQHYNTAIARMKNFGVNVQVLNRFKSPKECEKIITDLQLGKVDLIVGTHKLLGSKVKFKNLGLLILDEEQKFGVGDKDKIKNLKNNVNVLTLSATPIPRTLNISLTGIRDISVIATPPAFRMATQVQVVEYNINIIKSAIVRELDRHGQVLVIYNKVESIYQFAGMLRKILGDDVSLGVAHGQMDKKELEDAIVSLYNRTTQVLVATTLIENGVDLPNANTLIVVDADSLGLSQLYQLKGRIGRADKQSYAYFMFRSNNLNENAYKRLQAITEFTAMGSGFKIAMRDLEIRGAGNVFGAEQSGHMQKIGYSLYLQLLTEAISESKGLPITHAISDVRIEFGLDAYIPTEYVSSYDLRLRLYNKISKIDSMANMIETLKYIENICGELPDPVTNLCKCALIKNYSAKLGVKRVVMRLTECYIVLTNENIERFRSALDNFANCEYNMGDVPIIKFNNISGIDNMLDAVLSFMDYCNN